MKRSKPDVVDVADFLFECRAIQRRHFPPSLFSDPAWDVLLFVFARDLDDERVTLSELAAGTGLRGATTARWVVALERQGYLTSVVSPFPGHGPVLMTEQGRAALNEFLDSIGSLKSWSRVTDHLHEG